MAKGDTFNVTAGDEIELTFQLNLKRADMAKRNDAAKHTHVTISFDPESIGGNPPPGTVKFTPLTLGSDPNDNRNEILEITTDDPKFTRLYKVGIPRDLSGNILNDIVVRARAATVPKEGEVTPSTLPNDPQLCKIRVRVPAAK